MGKELRHPALPLYIKDTHTYITINTQYMSDNSSFGLWRALSLSLALATIPVLVHSIHIPNRLFIAQSSSN